MSSIVSSRGKICHKSNQSNPITNLQQYFTKSNNIQWNFSWFLRNSLANSAWPSLCNLAKWVPVMATATAGEERRVLSNSRPCN